MVRFGYRFQNLEPEPNQISYWFFGSVNRIFKLVRLIRKTVRFAGSRFGFAVSVFLTPLLGILHASPSCSLPSLSPNRYNLSLFACHDMLKGDVFDCMDSLGTFRGYDPSLDPYSLYLGSMPAKIMVTTVFRFFTNFTKAFGKFKRALTIISTFFLSTLTHPHLSYMLRCLISFCEL